MNGYDWIISLGMVCVHLCVVEAIKFCLRHNCFRKEKERDPLEKEWYMG